MLAVLATLAALTVLASCGDPQRTDPVGTEPQSTDPVPPGRHLYCITNVGHTLIAYSLAQREVLSGTARVLDLDPVGPWFAGSKGYYLSRVHSSGAGGNALVEFDHETTAETDRLKFPANSNPNSLLLLPAPHTGWAWVALRGSTFDNFATDGVSVVKLSSLQDTAFCDLNQATGTCARLAPQSGMGLTSPLGFLWDGACDGGNGCAYLVVNNFDGSVRDGWLLALRPNGQHRPVLLDAIALGRNPQQDLVLEASGELWVVNNGGFVHFNASGRPGTLQTIDTAAIADGTPGNETLATIPMIQGEVDCDDLPDPDPGCDPTGIYSTGGGTAWVTTYPDDVLRTVDLTTNTLDAIDDGLPRVTGPFFPVTEPALFAALGGLGTARLGELNAGATALLRNQSLQAGLAPLSCNEHQVP